MGEAVNDGGGNGPDATPRRVGVRALVGALGGALAAGLGEAAARPGKGHRNGDKGGKDDRDRDDRRRQDDDADDADGKDALDRINAGDDPLSLVERVQALAAKQIERLREDAEEQADRLRESAGIETDGAGDEDEEDGVDVERGADGSISVATDNISYREGPDGISVETDNVSFGGAGQTDGDDGDGGTVGDGDSGGDDGDTGGNDPGFQS